MPGLLFIYGAGAGTLCWGWVLGLWLGEAFAGIDELETDSGNPAADIAYRRAGTLAEIVEVEGFPLDDEGARESVVGAQTCVLRFHNLEAVVAKIADQAFPARLPHQQHPGARRQLPVDAQVPRKHE